MVEMASPVRYDYGATHRSGRGNRFRVAVAQGCAVEMASPVRYDYGATHRSGRGNRFRVAVAQGCMVEMASPVRYDYGTTHRSGRGNRFRVACFVAEAGTAFELRWRKAVRSKWLRQSATITGRPIVADAGTAFELPVLQRKREPLSSCGGARL